MTWARGSGREGQGAGVRARDLRGGRLRARAQDLRGGQGAGVRARDLRGGRLRVRAQDLRGK